MEDRVEQHGDRLRKVDQAPGFGVREDRFGVAQVGLDDGGALVLLQQGRAVHEDHRVVVDVDHTRGRVDPLGDLVDIVPGGQP